MKMLSIQATSRQRPALIAPFWDIYRSASPLAVTTILLLLLMIPTAFAGFIDARLFNGINIWIKPLKFQFSMALHLGTIALAMLLLPEPVRVSRTVRVLCWALIVSALFEVTYIGFQASNGAGSHFNLSSVWTGRMYSLMGVGAVTLVLAAAWIGALILRHGDRSNPLVLASGLGLVLGGVLGGVTGGYMSAQPGHWVGTMASDATGLWLFGWSRLGGDLRVAHFFGLHMMQALPIAAWLTMQIAPRATRPVIVASALFGTAVTAATFLQSIAGRPLLAL
jgi:hypothetical protein